jgi:hypothetical protein
MPIFSLKYSNFILDKDFVNTSATSSYVVTKLEPHWSLLYYILDIVVSDLDML